MEMSLVQRYTKAVIHELRNASSVNEVNSIYFGGGTPSLIPEDCIEAILETCRQTFTISEDCEVTLEANPGTISANKADYFQTAGITRLSLGAQSFEDKELKAVGRLHSAGMVLESLNHLRHGGFSNINLDLMLGLPLQTRESWERNLAAIVQCSIPHVSIYMLDLEGATGLLARVKDGSLILPDEDCICDLYIDTLDFLSSRGFVHYEISNFARPGYRCRHNLKYWKREAVLGFGAGSHSFDGQSRYANTGSVEDYCTRIETGISPVIWKESLTAEQTIQESIFLGLRLTEGVDWDHLQSMDSGGILKTYEASLRGLCSDGLIEKNGSNYALTIRGMLLSNEVFQVFV
jgi:oxygen-independent coproporphyrinogen-3 oxidase